MIDNIFLILNIYIIIYYDSIIKIKNRSYSIMLEKKNLGLEINA